jgi:hypothetical protein
MVMKYVAHAVCLVRGHDWRLSRKREGYLTCKLCSARRSESAVARARAGEGLGRWRSKPATRWWGKPAAPVRRPGRALGTTARTALRGLIRLAALAQRWRAAPR